MQLSLDHKVYIEQLPFPVILLHKSGSIKGVSNHCLSFLGKTHEQVISLDLNDLFTLDARVNHMFLDKNNTELDRYIVIDYQIENELKKIQINFFPLEDSDLQYLVLEDVSKKVGFLEMARQAQRTAKIGIWEVDLINSIVFWSNMTRQIHEVPEDYKPCLEKGIEFYKEGNDRDKIVEAVSNAIEKGENFDVELVIVTHKGNEKWVRAIGNVEQVNGKSIRLFGVFQDIDEQKKEQEKYQELHDRMRIAVESANIGIWDFNLVNDELVWDDNMYQLYGVNKEDFDGHFSAWESTVHPDDKERALHEVELALKGEKDFDTTFRIIKGDGTISNIRGEGKVFHNAAGNPIRMIGANTDITDITKAQRKLSDLLKITETQNKSLLNFAHVVSHNLRSNTSNLSTLTGMLLESISPENQQKFIEMIKVSTEKLDETILQLNEVIKIRQEHDKNLEHILIAPCFANAVESINAHLEKEDIVINYNIPTNTKIHALKPYLSSIFLNLLTNSIKYRKKDEKLIVDVDLLETTDAVEIRFSDNGMGIDLDRYGKKLFGMYKTFHGNKDAKGIGLFMTKNQLEAMGAQIKVFSEVNVGTTFKMIFNKLKD